MADSTGSHAPRSPFRAWQAFLWSMKGLRATWDAGDYATLSERPFLRWTMQNMRTRSLRCAQA